jgi:hypothetical protein
MTKKNTGPQQEPEKDFEQMELSDTWRELLGQRLNASARKPADGKAAGAKSGVDGVEQAEGEKAIPTLKSDPWSTLIQAKGIEVVDLHKAHLQISAQEVERILKLMHEYPAQDDGDSSSLSQRRGYDHED